MGFKSEGGALHKWFLRFVNFSVINYFLVYWLIDLIVLRSIISYEPPNNESQSGDYAKLGGLFGLQIFSTMIQVGYRNSLVFDYDLANAQPEEFVRKEYKPELEGLVDNFEVPETEFRDEPIV